jgi:hypothetical protein
MTTIEQYKLAQAKEITALDNGDYYNATMYEEYGFSSVNEAKEIIGSWNGKDNTFYHDGVMYHEDDVSRLEELIEE